MNLFRNPAFRVSQQILIVGVAACLMSPVWAASGTIHAVGLDANTHRLTVDASGPVHAVVNTVTMNGRKRIIIDIQDASIGYDLPKDADLLARFAATWPSVKNVSINQFGSGAQSTVRILMDVDGDIAQPQALQASGSHLEVQIGNPPLGGSTTTAAIRPTVRTTPVVEPQSQRLNPEVGQVMDEQRRMIVALQQQMAELAKNQNDEISRLRDTNANLKTQIQSQPVDNAHAQAELSNLKQSVVKLNDQVRNLNSENQNLKTKLAVSTPPSGTAVTKSITSGATMPTLKPSVPFTPPVKPAPSANTSPSPKGVTAPVLTNKTPAATNANKIAADTKTQQELVARQAEIDRLRKMNQSLQDQLALSLKKPTTPAAPVKPATTSKPVANTAEMDALKKNLAAANQKADSLTKENKDLQIKLTAASKTSAAAPKTTAASTKPAATNTAELDAAKKNLAAANQKADTLSKENTSLKAKLAATPTQPANDPHVKELAELRAENARLKTQPVELKDNTDELTAQLNRYKEKAEDLQAQLANAQIENGKLKTEAAKPTVASATTNNPELGELNAQLQAAQESLNTSITTINDQNKEIAYLRNQVTELKRGYDDSAKEQIASLKSEMDAKDTQIRALKEQAAGKPDSQAEALKRQLDKLSEQYKGNLDDLTREKESLNKQLAENRTRLQEAQTKQTQLSSELNRMQAEQGKKGSEKDLAVLTMQKEMDADKAQIASLRENVTELQAENEKLAAAAATVAQVKAPAPDMTQFVAKAELEAAQRDNTALKTTMLKMNEQIEALQKAPKPSAKVDLSKYVAKTDMEKTLSENGNLKADLAKASSENTSLKNSVDRLSAENKTLTASLDKAGQAPAATATAPANTAELAKLNEQNTMLQNQLTEMKTRHEDAVKDVNQNRQQIAKLEQDLKEAKAKAAAKAPKADKNAPAVSPELQAKVDELSKQLETAKQENASLQTQVSELSKVNGEKNVSTQPATGGAPASFALAEKHFAEAKSLMDANNTKKAIDEYKQALQLDPNNSEYVYQYTIALAEDKQYDTAINILLKHLQRNPGDRLAYHQLGKIYLLNDQVDAANQALSRALPVSTLNNYATSLKKLNRLSEAEAVYKLALTLSPNDTEVLFNLGTLYNASNKLEDAKTTYQEALRLKPDFAEAHYNLGLIYSKMGDKAQAIDHLEKFLKLSPNARNAETIRNYVAKLKA